MLITEKQYNEHFSIFLLCELMENLGFHCFSSSSFDCFYISLRNGVSSSSDLFVEGERQVTVHGSFVRFTFYKQFTRKGQDTMTKCYCENVSTKEMLKKVSEFLLFCMEKGILPKIEKCYKQAVEIKRWKFEKHF